MNGFFQYLLQSSACIAAFYLVYWIFLRKETFFIVNRFYLISAVILSILIPLTRIDLYYFGPVRSFVVYLDPVIITPERIEHVTSQYWTGIQTLWIIYITGVMIFLTRFLFKLIQLVFLTRKHEISQKESINLVFIEETYSPFSFFNYIYVNPGQIKDKDHGISTIINHELVHVKQFHSIDLIIHELLIIVQWFNPFVWFIGRSIKTNHEFLADEGVLKNGFNKWEYQELLLTRATGIQVNDLTNNFNVSLLKKRIIMMTKTRSTTWATWKIMFAFPAFILVMFLFSTNSFSQILAQTVGQNTNKETMKSSSTPSDSKSSDQQIAQAGKKESKKQQTKYTAPVVLDSKTTSKGEDIYTVVEKQPAFPGGQDGLVKFLMENIKYPAPAIEKGIVGKVYLTFVVKADGAVTDVKILRGVGGGCDEEALRVVQMMPKWEPGTVKGKPVNVQFNLPINFQLDKKDKEKKKE
jgi:TonB family protein